MNYIEKIFFLVNEKKIIIFGLVLLFFLSSLFEVLGIGLLGSFVAFLTNSNLESETSIGKLFYFFENLGFNLSSINSLALFIIFILLIRFFFQIVANYFILSFTNNSSKNLRNKLIGTYLNLNYLDFINKDSSSSYNEITTLTDQFINLLFVSLKLISDIILLTFIVTMLFLVNTKIFIILFLIFSSLFFINRFFFSKKISQLGIRSNQLTEQIFKYFKDGLIGFKQIKVLGKTNFILEKISNSLKKHTSLLIKYNFFLVLIRYFIELIIAVIFIATAIFIYNFYSTGNALIIITVFGISAIRILPIATNLINSMNVLFYSKNAIDRLTNSLKLKIDKNFSESQVLSQEIDFEKFEIKKINFGYENKTILNNINLEINLKDLIFITGPSGSGKTTLLDIITGLIKPNSGLLSVNGKSSKEYLNSFRNKIYYLSQKSFILNDTLYNNITFTDNEIDMERLSLAIKLSGLEEFKNKLQNTNTRNLGEDASKISGGETQRIALARALYANKEILILDEFTSSLDKKNEEKIFETILELNKSKTIIIVSHNNEIKRFAKKNYKIDNGQLLDIK